ncbi:MAG: restriction endonuclease subunit S [Terriglobales bacterium]
MIADLKPYPEYKESGVPRLAQVPERWDTRRLRHVCEIRVSGVDKHTRDGETPVRLCNYLDVYKNERIRASMPFMSASASEDERIRFGLRKWDVVITKDSEGWNDIGVPSLVESEAPDLICGYHLAILRARPILQGPYLHRALQSRPIAAQFYIEATGVTRYGLTRQAIKGATIPLPPPAEQAAIVRFLDWANGRLDRAIRTKRKVIALLNEQKQAIIHRAVTRGLDPSVPLKPSGVPWLGEIPHHWTLRRFKFLATVNSGHIDPRRAEYRHLVLIAPNHIQSGSGRLLAQETADEQGADSGKYFVRGGQVIYSKIRPNLGKATIAPCDCLCSADMYPITPKTRDLSAEYLLLLLLSQPFTKFAVDTSMRVAMPKVNREALANCLMWYPSRQEQAEILGFIAREGEPLATAISRLEREIELLREYRTRLVSDVATGKLDVREAAARLPVEVAPDVADDAAGTGDETDSADEEAALA